MGKKLIIIQAATPDYRGLFFQELRSHLGDHFELYRGKRYFDPSVVSDSSIDARPLRNFYFLGRRALFQGGIWHLLLSNSALVMELQPRNITTWMFLVIRRITGKETVLWGHAWPRAGKDSGTDRLRHVMRGLSSKIIVYTQKQAEDLKKKMPSKSITAAPNAVIKAQNIEATVNDNEYNLIYVGRLSAAKKPLFLVKAFHKSLDVLPKDVKLIFVGDGEERRAIERFIETSEIEERVQLKGHVKDVALLKQWYSSALFSVSPGYVGLSITQSFSFGVPMLVSREEPHAPEIEALKEGENGLYFESDDAVGFRESLKSIYNNIAHWEAKRAAIAKFCKENYSIERMAQAFVNLVSTDEA